MSSSKILDVLRRTSKDPGEERRGFSHVFAQMKGHTTGEEGLPMGLSPSPTFADVYSDHGTYVLAH